MRPPQFGSFSLQFKHFFPTHPLFRALSETPLPLVGLEPSPAPLSQPLPIPPFFPSAFLLGISRPFRDLHLFFFFWRLHHQPFLTFFFFFSPPRLACFFARISASPSPAPPGLHSWQFLKPCPFCFPSIIPPRAGGPPSPDFNVFFSLFLCPAPPFLFLGPFFLLDKIVSTAGGPWVICQPFQPPSTLALFFSFSTYFFLSSLHVSFNRRVVFFLTFFFFPSSCLPDVPAVFLVSQKNGPPLF